MAFSDWPLSSGSVNPPGWLYVQPQLLEHGHRLLASSVGILVLSMFLWQWRHSNKPLWIPAILVASFVLMLLTVHSADGIAKGSESAVVKFVTSIGIGERALWSASIIIAGSVLIWLLRLLLDANVLPLLKLTSAALVVVVIQAILGGLRVLAVSDPFGIAHGCLGQLFFCLLVFMALMASRAWKHGEIIASGRVTRRLQLLSTALFAATSMQLLFGAIVRHTQRAGLAATDLFTTGHQFLPPSQPFDVFSIFLHKTWALVVFVLAISTAVAARRPWRVHGWVAALPILLVMLPIIQITLGVFVLFSNKKFWVTNIHVLNGLIFLAATLVTMITAWRAYSAPGNPSRKYAGHE